MDQLDPSETAAVPDTKATDSPIAPPAAGDDAPESLGHATPLGLRSSPPPSRPPTNAPLNRAASHTESGAGSQSDSEAETVVLPGVDGFSPSKIRKERNIKLEDRGNVFGPERANVNNAPEAGEDETADQKQRESVLQTDNTASLLGKRKRTKHGISRLDDTHGGNSSGLSSVPTSPLTHARSNLGKRAASESDERRSLSPRKAGSERATKSKRRAGSTSERDKEFKRTHARRSSARDTSGIERYGERRTKLPGEASTRRPRTHSPSPTRERGDTDSLSGHRSASSGAASGLGNRKKSIPPPLRPIKSHHSAESDDSSGIESTYPRRSKTRHQGTPPTAGSMQRMAHRRNRQDRYGRTPLADATEAGNFEKTKRLLGEFPEDLDVPDAAGNTPLQCAALNGHADIVKLLIINGCAIDCKNNEGDFPLLDAVENNHLDVVKLLLEAGVDPRARNKRGEDPIAKIDDEHEDADEMRAALQAAKLAHAAKSRPSEAGHTPHQESIETTNRKSLSHGRANRTGQSLLYERFDIHGLRDAAAKGDTERVVNILGVLENVDDAEATLAAAKGGHIDALEMLFGLGNANPDPAPVKSAPWEFATPMLAAIGGDNTKVVSLLLQQARDRKFDPTKTFKGKTYYEIARERAGPVWVEEERLLKEAYDEYASQSPASTRSTGGKNKQDDGKRVKSKRETRGPDMSSPVRRGPGRPRKDNNDDAEHEPPSTASHREEEAEQAKPRRKLVSGRELKDAAQEKSKPAGSTPPPPPKGETSGQRDQKHVAEKNKAHDSDAMEGVESTHTEQVRPTRRDKSSERASVVRGSSPTKRPRHASPTPSEPTDLGHKKRRTESDARKRRQSDAGQGPTAEKRIPLPSGKERVSKEKTSPIRAMAENKESVRPAPLNTSMPMDVDNVRPTRSSPERVRQKLPEKPLTPATADDTAQYVGQKRSEDLEAEVKSVMAAATAKRREAERQNEEATRKSDAERQAEAAAEARRQEQEREKKRAAIARRLEEEARLAAIKAEPAPETATLVQPGDILGSRESREALVDVVLSREEKARREIEEAELREKQRREASEQRHREEEQRAAEKAAEEERKRAAREEIERHQQQERERQKREKQQERARLKKEREDARLAKLPPLLRWWETAEKVDTPEIAECFTEMFAARYDTIVPDVAKRDLSIDGREQYILNTHAACLLGEKDLELTRYTAWERVPASKWALHGYWRLESDLYSMIESGLDIRSPDLSPYFAKSAAPEIDPNHVAAIRRAAKDLFINLPLFFVKLSDVMFIVPKKQHLRNLKMVVHYHEALPDETFVMDWTKKQKKWKTDPGADANAWCPGPKTYVNGVCVDQVKPQRAEWTVRPYLETTKEKRQKSISEIQHGYRHDRGEPMEVDTDGMSSSPVPVAAARRALPTDAPTNGGSDGSMNGHFAGDFAGYSMHGATGSRPSSSGPDHANHGDGHGPDHPAHPSLPTFRTLSPEMRNGDLLDNPASENL